MAMAKEGARLIEVDGVLYRWRIRRKSTAAQKSGESNLSVGIEQVVEQGAVTTLVVDTSTLRTYWREDDGNRDDEPVSVTPAAVVSYIRQALKQGWKPAERGSTFTLVGDESLVWG